MSTSQLNTAVLFLVFNRPDTTALVFEEIRKARPPRLYIACDGPRAERDGDVERVSNVRQIVTHIDWPCEVKTLFRQHNIGCKYAVSGAITWFFENETEGIILEDDCLPHPDFFTYCEDLLIRYAEDPKISMISGINFNNFKIEESYYFSRYIHIWGWATWRRAWQQYDLNLSFWPDWKKTNEWKCLLNDGVARKYWEKLFDHIRNDNVDTWDYQWTASIWYAGGLAVNPSVNLIRNIGFGMDATRTKGESNIFANRATSSLGALIHPASVRKNSEIEQYEFNYIFMGINRRWPRCLIYFPYLAVMKIVQLVASLRF